MLKLVRGDTKHIVCVALEANTIILILVAQTYDGNFGVLMHTSLIDH